MTSQQEDPSHNGKDVQARRVAQFVGYAVDHQPYVQDSDNYEKPSHTPQYWQVLVHILAG
jgi:hypothetical protein